MQEEQRRRHDPDRRDRIIAATLELIVQAGVAGATYRTVAQAAGVPLGSMTYHFPSRDDLVFAAFERFADETLSPLEQAMARTESAPAEALTRLVVDDEDRRTKILLAELYVLAFRLERYADLLRHWMHRSRAVIEARVPGVDGRVIDAVQEGLGIQRFPLPEEVTEGVVRGVFSALLSTSPAAGSPTHQEKT